MSCRVGTLQDDRRLFSSRPCHRKPGPKGLSEALIQAIVELKSRNPRFGCPRIAHILSQTFGVDIDKKERRGADGDGELSNASWIEEERSESAEQPVAQRQVGRAPAGAPQDDQLLFEHEILCDHRSHATTVLVARQDLTGVDRRWAGHYATGDVVRYTRGSPEHALDAGAYARVTAIDATQNTLTVARGDGRSVTYDPRRLQGVTVYRDVERTFAVGDRVQFTAPFRTAKIANREMATITAMTERQEIRVRTDTGKTVKFSVDSKAHGPRVHRHLDHGYAVTSYSSQGLTADRVLLYIDSEQTGERLVNQRLAYVALSRGRHDAQIYTDDRDRLSTALSRDVSKSSAHAVRPTEQTSQRDGSPSRQSALKHTTTIDAGMAPPSVGRERGLPDVMPRSTGPRLSTEELQRAREYLARPETQQYLRAREVLYRRTPQPQAAVAIEARHVATVFRELAGERGSRFAPMPATTVPVPSTTRVMEAAVAVANGEAGASNRLGVTAKQGVAHGSEHVPGRA